MASLALTACAVESVAPREADSPPTLAALQGIDTVGATKPLAAVAGAYRRPAFGQRSVKFYGTDLGWTFVHNGQLWVLFGDSWKSWTGATLTRDADDALGLISLKDFPDGDSVERWVAAHPPGAGQPLWAAAAPPINMVIDILDRVLPIRQLLDGQSLTSASGLAPIAGFSNARTGAESAAFGLFLRNEPVQCSAAGTCSDGFDCDAQLGRCAPVHDLSLMCVLGTTSCNCVPIGNKKGLCQDRGSSLYNPESERGRSNAVVMRQQIGNALRNSLNTFATQPWDTHRFFNATARTVNDFDPERFYGEGNDYATADGKDYRGEGVFLWGRPNFGGVGAQGRDAQLYFAWAPLPTYESAGNFDWSPRYFTGVDAQGRPEFSAREHDAKPIDLDDTEPGTQPHEVRDVVGQMSISWVPALKRWVMLYGGDMGTQFIDAVFGPDAKLIQRDPLGAIYIRYAKQPWGPWSPPKPVLIAGSPENGIVGQYGPGGILYHGGCTQRGCAPSEVVFTGLPDERGRLYGPNIVEPWTELRAGGAVDLYWHVSTWNPYQIVLMRTRLSPP
ncbi:MAG: hypothetical protein ABW252_19585 [Polyangiales bacterium]